MDVELSPLRAYEWPLVLMPLDEFLARVAHLQHRFWLFAPTSVLAFEEVPEKLLLQSEAVIRVEMCPMLDAMHLKPLLVRRGAHEAFEIAARMQALPAPIGR